MIVYTSQCYTVIVCVFSGSTSTSALSTRSRTSQLKSQEPYLPTSLVHLDVNTRGSTVHVSYSMFVTMQLLNTGTNNTSTASHSAMSKRQTCCSEVHVDLTKRDGGGKKFVDSMTV